MGKGPRFHSMPLAALALRCHSFLSPRRILRPLFNETRWSAETGSEWRFNEAFACLPSEVGINGNLLRIFNRSPLRGSLNRTVSFL